VASDQKDQKIYMVTGKGGVGKSLVAAAVATSFARKGLKTLLVELGDQSSYQYVFDKAVSYKGTLIENNLSVALWNGEACLKEYITYLIKVPALADLFMDNKIMRTFIRAAPALKELAVLGKITSGIRNWGPELTFDRIVVDGYATGHFMALLKAPIGMAELISAGPMGEQSRNITTVLNDSESTKYLIVSLLEELPISESLELRAELKKWVKADALVLANQFFHSGLSAAELEQLKMKDASNSDFIEYIGGLQARSERGLARLNKENLPLIQLPYVLQTKGRQIIEILSKKLDLQ
jgi:anion-transporting  ArsA/GET3 family ATPase